MNRRPVYLAPSVARALVLSVLCAVSAACASTSPPPVPDPDRATAEPGSPEVDDGCAERRPADDLLPGVAQEHLSPAFWLQRSAELGDLDAVLIEPDAIARLNASIRSAGLDRAELLAPVDPEALRRSLSDRLGFVAAKLASGDYVDATGQRLDAAPLLELDPGDVAFVDEIRVATGELQFRCAPLANDLFTPSLDLRFDRNNCSGAHAHEPVRVLARWPDGWLLLSNAHSMGWVAPDAALSPPLTDAQRMWVGTAQPVIVPAMPGDGAPEPVEHVRLLTDGTGALVASPDGVRTDAPIPADARPTRPLTRRNFIEAAFAYLGEPYGWGDEGGGRDCSRFVLDLLAEFGVELPRFSGNQAVAGTFSIDMAPVVGEHDRALMIDAAARRGIVLLHFPGHIMVYLGRAADGRPMAIHAFAEYLEPCASGTGYDDLPQTLRTVDRITVTDLSLGAGTSRGAFIDRITRVTVIGMEPGPGLRGAATLRPPAPPIIPDVCPDDAPWAFFHSPRLPGADGDLRFIVTGDLPPASAELLLIDPAGDVLRPDPLTLGGPPWSLVATVPNPSVGRWRVALADGDALLACGEVTVRERTAQADTGAMGGGAWDLRGEWSRDTENLWSAFIEQLFAYPIDEDLTWTSLHEILQNPDKNLLYGHLGMGEEELLRMTPDCADLPYLLRAYFAWKVGLSFGYRECSRGRAGRPPSCGAPITNLTPRTRAGDVDAFLDFANRGVRNGVHSASGRTVPSDDETDWYPVELTHESLRPGTVYADPYGHIMMLTRWVEQSATSYGVLMAADAQPDATIGRRRFWRGTFLFTAAIDSVGAGFKAWRPLVRDGAGLRALTNAELEQSAVSAPWSDDQYAGTDDDFYDSVEALINPRALDPWSVQVSLIDALEESVVRRVNSVETGEEWKRSNGYPPIDMPTGAAIFQTSGPWEDFSTPSRDLRLLVAVDTVLDFPDAVRRRPERFGVAASGADLDAVVSELAARRDAELAARSFDYVRSDRSPWTLSLADVVARQVEFEVTWNPNDCAELRWAAPEGSAEASTCVGRRPASQEARMQEYRTWFRERRRPQ